MHGGSHNASTAPYRTAFYLEVENDALEGRSIAWLIPSPRRCWIKNMPTVNAMRSMPS
jgi:hypothetical protein